MVELIIVRGISGAGKSTFSKQLAQLKGYSHHEVDAYRYDSNGNYKFDPNTVEELRLRCLRGVIADLEMGIGVVVSNTFTTKLEVDQYLRASNILNIRSVVLIIEKTHTNDNIHNTPQHEIDKMKTNFEYF